MPVQSEHLPDGWVISTIGEIADKCSQRKPADNENFIYIDIGSIDRERKTISEPQHLIGKDAPSRARKEVNAGDVLVSLTRPNLNAVALVGCEYDGQIASTGFEVLKPTLVEAKYLFSIVRSRDFVDAITGKVQGALYPAAKAADVRGFQIPLPSLAEQKQIAAKLDELLAQVDSIKTRLDAIPAILKRFRQSVLAAAVSGRLTEEWRGSSDRRGWVDGVLGDFVKKPSYGTSSKSQKVGEVPVLRMGNLQDGKLDWSDLVYTSDASEIKKYRLQSGDVLFNRTNSPELVGKTSIYRGEREAIYAGYLIRIQCDEGLDPEFLNYHLNSPGAKDYCHAVKSDGVSQSNINAKKLVAYALNKPPFEEQAEIIRRVGQYFTFADQIEQRVKDAQSRVNHLTQSILAKAFRGELTAEWREQNPDLISGENSAQALLECIKTEQAKLKKPKKKARKKSSA
jgi:type I restriction enzyme, S subunit